MNKVKRWYFLSPSGVLLVGSGAVIEGCHDNPAIIEPLVIEAQRLANVHLFGNGALGDGVDVTAPLLLALAQASAHEIAPISPIQSLGQILEFLKPTGFSSDAIEATAIAFYNSIRATTIVDNSAPSSVNLSADELLLRITAAFERGELLRYPQHRRRLGEASINETLPGVMRFLLTNEAITEKSFQDYLRKGITPEASYQRLWSEAKERKGMSTWGLEHAMDDVPSCCAHHHGHSAHQSHYHNHAICDQRLAKKHAPGDKLRILEIIYDRMLSAKHAARDAADEHRVAFDLQIRDLFGIIPPQMEEPYLESEVKRFELQLLQTLDRLAARMEKLLDGRKGALLLLDEKAIDPSRSLPPQIIDQAATETNRMKGRFKQALDGHRQQQMGVTHYIWRSRDDSKVRLQHAAYDDQIFAWDSPPAGGHPGKAFNCRCYAEPVANEAGVQVALGPLAIPAGISAAEALAGSAILAGIAAKIAQESPPIRLPRFEFEGDEGEQEDITESEDDFPRTAFSDQDPPEEDPDDEDPDDEEDIFKRPDGVPEDWIEKPAKKGEGIKYVDPSSKGSTYVRVSKGKSASSHPGQRNNYVRWQKNGQSLDKNGNVVPKNSQQSHIPLKDFNFK